jgi:hypothetical protein
VWGIIVGDCCEGVGFGSGRGFKDLGGTAIKQMIKASREILFVSLIRML